MHEALTLGADCCLVTDKTCICAQAMEVVRLKDRLAEAEEGRRDTHAKLAAARADVHRLEDRVTALERDLDQAHTCVAFLSDVHD